MRHRSLFPIIALCLLPHALSAAPIHIRTTDDAPDAAKYAADELQSYLSQLTEQNVTTDRGEGTNLVLGIRGQNPLLDSFTPALPQHLAPQEILVQRGRLDRHPAVAVTGGSEFAVLWAAYALLESLGVVFEFSGEILPDRKPMLDLSDISLRWTPEIAERGPRLHLNFPMDQSSYSLPEFLQWVDRMARLKLNYLMLHFYAAHPWFYFRYRDAEARGGRYFVGSSLFGGNYELPPDMIGRELIRNDRYYMPPELENMEPGIDLIRRTEQRIRKVIDRAHARGMKVCIAFEPLSPPSDIRSHVPEWLNEAVSRRALWQDLTAARLLAAMDAYPRADEFQLISVEGSSDAPGDLDLKAELRRLCDKYAIPFDPDDEAHFAGAKQRGVNLAPYNSPDVAAQLEHGLYRPVVSALRFTDIALHALKDPRVADRLQKERKEASVAIYLPHAKAVGLCVPALSVMMPPRQRLQLMVDYGARGTADQMPNWDAFKGADIDLGVMTWIEFDGLMFLPQAWPRALYDCVRNARDLPLHTLAANHWRVSGLEADAAAFAQLPWRPQVAYDDWFDAYLARVFGPDRVDLARTAYDTLAEATLHSRRNLMNVGFCWEGRYRHNIWYNREHLQTARDMFDRARSHFDALAQAIDDGRPKQRALYLANRCKCGVIHLDVMERLMDAQARPDDPPERLEKAANNATQALQLARDYMQTYSQFVLDRGDEGMLVNYHFAVVKRARELADTARHIAAIAAANPETPVMQWSFETAENATIPDVTGNGFDLQHSGNVQLAEGRVGNGLNLDGESYLQVTGGHAFNPKNLSIALWIEPRDLDARAGLIAKRLRNREAPFVFTLDGDKLRFEGCDDTNEFWPFNFSGPAVEADTWTHVAATLKGGSEIKLFVNGQLAARKGISANPQPTTGPLIIGREAWGGDAGHNSPAYFDGVIDELAIYKRALTDGEIATLATQP